MTRLIDMLAGGGWLLLFLFGAQFLAAWHKRTAHNRAIDRQVAAGNARRATAGPPANRQQRRALERANKGKRP